MKAEKLNEWIEARAQFLRGLKNTNAQQQLFLALYNKDTKTAQEEKTFSLLVQAERCAQKAQDAKAKALNFIQLEKRLAAKQKRKQRDHELYKCAALLIDAGLVDSKSGKPFDEPATLLRALFALNNLSRTDPIWNDLFSDLGWQCLPLPPDELN
ncbi:MAG: hypothetical protein ACRC9R_01740 [Enterovibrio sp.]